MCVSLDQVKDFSNNPQNIRKHSLQESRLYMTAHFEKAFKDPNFKNQANPEVPKAAAPPMSA